MLGGQLMDMGDELGLLAPGYLADVLVVRGDPTGDVKILQHPGNLAYIVQGGRFHKQPNHGQPDHRQPDHGEPDHGEPDHGQPDHGEPAPQ
jgi:cytosine/adenosine deaminase-related metal-dependent hydrolase